MAARVDVANRVQDAAAKARGRALDHALARSAATRGLRDAVSDAQLDSWLAAAVELPSLRQSYRVALAADLAGQPGFAQLGGDLIIYLATYRKALADVLHGRRWSYAIVRRDLDDDAAFQAFVVALRAGAVARGERVVVRRGTQSLGHRGDALLAHFDAVRPRKESRTPRGRGDAPLADLVDAGLADRLAKVRLGAARRFGAGSLVGPQTLGALAVAAAQDEHPGVGRAARRSLTALADEQPLAERAAHLSESIDPADADALRASLAALGAPFVQARRVAGARRWLIADPLVALPSARCALARACARFRLAPAEAAELLGITEDRLAEALNRRVVEAAQRDGRDPVLVARTWRAAATRGHSSDPLAAAATRILGEAIRERVRTVVRAHGTAAAAATVAANTAVAGDGKEEGERLARACRREARLLRVDRGKLERELIELVPLWVADGLDLTGPDLPAELLHRATGAALALAHAAALESVAPAPPGDESPASAPADGEALGLSAVGRLCLKFARTLRCGDCAREVASDAEVQYRRRAHLIRNPAVPCRHAYIWRITSNVHNDVLRRLARDRAHLDDEREQAQSPADDVVRLLRAVVGDAALEALVRSECPPTELDLVADAAARRDVAQTRSDLAAASRTLRQRDWGPAEDTDRALEQLGKREQELAQLEQAAQALLGAAAGLFRTLGRWTVDGEEVQALSVWLGLHAEWVEPRGRDVARIGAEQALDPALLELLPLDEALADDEQIAAVVSAYRGRYTNGGSVRQSRLKGLEKLAPAERRLAACFRMRASA